MTKHLQARYGVSVEVAGIKPPLKGDLDGSHILVADHNTDEERLFLVAHLFGHTVQWNVSAESRRLGMTMPVKPTSEELDALEAYEREACRYSQQAIHEASVSRSSGTIKTRIGIRGAGRTRQAGQSMPSGPGIRRS